MTAKLVKCVAIAALAASASGCGEFTREGQSPVILVVDSIDVENGGTLLSDVLQLVTTPSPCSIQTPCPVVFNDMADVRLHLILKDPGPPGVTASPSDLNSVTVNRYRVEYRRTDGRSTPGVDVPYAFDSAATFTVPRDGTGGTSFELVRHSAKEEAPLRTLASNGDIIATIATVTFYGRDQAGNDIIASANVGINFGNFADDGD